MEERLYDLVFICMPATPEEEITKLITTLEESVAKHGAKVEKVEKWGTRKMAYRVAKQREGYYVLMVLRGSQGELIKELERRLRVTDLEKPRVGQLLGQGDRHERPIDAVSLEAQLGAGDEFLAQRAGETRRIRRQLPRALQIG